MSFEVTPDRTIAIGPRSLVLSGNFGTLKTIQHAFAQDLIPLQARIFEMRQDEIARLVALASGTDEAEVGQLLLDELDVTSTDYLMLKAELMAWLAVAMTPKRDREKKVQATAEMLARLRGSRGGSTASSASASSAGPRRRSGKRPSGT
ncbi:MAG: hypothetical protein K8U57_30475 [Planctomycetes bacterium]|nr:hypothetical protein [Planctomycetota bacterium]